MSAEGMKFLFFGKQAEIFVSVSDLCSFLESLNLPSREQRIMNTLADQLRRLALGS